MSNEYRDDAAAGGPIRSLRDRVAARLFQARSGPPIPPGFPPHLGYLRPIASGASGEVHLANDASLGRPVAVKLLRSRGDPADLRRLHREARSLARLAHPNVVHIYEVGEHDGHLFLVMEYVDGGSLLERQRDPVKPFPLDAIVTAYREAAEGLAAAHSAGIVHRDVKPANLLIGEDARVRVADFGLAHPIDETTDPRPGDGRSRTTVGGAASSAPPSQRLASPIPPLATDSRLARGGTPAYMAPETIRSGFADARSDQFSWGVSFFEALFGHRPAMRTNAEDEARAGAVPSRTSSGARVPNYVRDTLARAMAPNPTDRAPSLAPIIAALRDGPSLVRRRRAGAVAIALTIATSVSAYAVARSRSACPTTDTLLDGTWDAAVASRVDTVLSSSSQAFAKTTAAYAIDTLDDYSERWRKARIEACELTRSRAERSETFLELANACLDSRRAQLDLLVEQLTSGGADVVGSVGNLIETLAPLEPCTNPAALEEGLEATFDVQRAARFAEIRDTIARARLASARGLQAEALRLVGHAVEMARDDGAPLILSESLLAAGELDVEMGNGSGANASLLEALDAAEAANAPSLKTSVLLTLALSDAQLNEHVERSDYHLERARGTMRRLAIDPDRDLRWLSASAARDHLAGDNVTAAATLRSAIEILGTNASVEAARLFHRLGDVFHDDDPDEARRHYEYARTIFTERLGPEHPLTLNVSFNLGLLDQARGDLDRAAIAFEHIRASLTAALGSEAPRLATIHTALADLANASGDPRRALVEGQRALAIEGTLPSREPTVMAAAHTAMGNAERLLGNPERSLAHTLAAYEIDAARLDPRKLVHHQTNIGEFLCAIGRCGEARPYYMKAAETLRTSTDPRARAELAYAMNGLGKVALYSRAFAEAATAYLVADQIASRELLYSDGPLNAEIHWGLAQARAGLGSLAEARVHAMNTVAWCIATGSAVGMVALDRPFSPTACLPQPPSE